MTIKMMCIWCGGGKRRTDGAIGVREGACCGIFGHVGVARSGIAGIMYFIAKFVPLLELMAVSPCNYFVLSGL